MKCIRHLQTAAAVATALAWGHPAYSAGTRAGTLIQNTATVTFDIGSGPVTLRSTTNVVKVDQLIGVAVTPQGRSPAAG